MPLPAPLGGPAGLGKAAGVGEEAQVGRHRWGSTSRVQPPTRHPPIPEWVGVTRPLGSLSWLPATLNPKLGGLGI